MQSFITIISMQGYGAYVWSSMFLTLGILLGNYGYANYQLQRAQKAAREQS